jgi:hypothetical protein
VESIQRTDGAELARAPFPLHGGVKTDGAWARLDSAVVSNDPLEWLRAFERAHPSGSLLIKRAKPRLIGLVFPEELGYRTIGDGWVFIDLRHERDRTGLRLVRCARAGVADLSARLPRFVDLEDRKIAVFGLGCIGAPSFLEFARAGVGELRCVEPDLVDVGTAVRWPFGVDAAGLSKAAVISEYVRREYPWVAVRSYEHRVGTVLQSSRDRDVLEKVLAGSDLVYDATAELGIQHLLSDQALKRGIPYVCISGTPGGASGVVARMRHDGVAGCWTCLQRAMNGGPVLLPVPIPGGAVQPRGCSNVTFVGANYDFMEIALQGVRLAIGTLLVRNEQTEDYDWDVAVLRSRKESGRRMAPSWTVYPLPRDAECPACQNR